MGEGRDGGRLRIAITAGIAIIANIEGLLAASSWLLAKPTEVTAGSGDRT
jgi:hypothetical protein